MTFPNAAHAGVRRVAAESPAFTAGQRSGGSSPRRGLSRCRTGLRSLTGSRAKSSRRTAPFTAARRISRALGARRGWRQHGIQIATELAASREVHLAIGSRQTPLPQRLLGRDLFWWLTTLG